MNKYKKTAYVTAIIGVITSVLFWTSNIGFIPLPYISEEVRGFVESFVSFTRDKDEVVSVQELEVEKLGSHFSTETTTTKVTASVITQSSSSIAYPKEESSSSSAVQEVIEEEKEVQEPVEDLMPAAPTELDQWELKRAWGIAVPSLGIRAPVMLPSLKYWSTQAWDLMEEQMQVGLNHGTVAYPHSSGPGGKGSLIIAGHSSPPTIEAEQSVYGSVFAKLPDIEIGEEVTVSTNAAPIRYKVEEKFVVSPSATSILEQQYDESVLKLITCYPVGTTTNRMIILAKKIEN